MKEALVKIVNKTFQVQVDGLCVSSYSPADMRFPYTEAQEMRAYIVEHCQHMTAVEIFKHIREDG